MQIAGVRWCFIIKKEKCRDNVLFRKRRVPLWLAYNLVLDCFALSKRTDLDDWVKIDFALCLLTKNNRWVTKLRIDDKAVLYRQILDEKINLNKKNGKSGPRVIDYQFDFDLIYSAFLQQYGVDLLNERDRLPWSSFFMQFQGLSGTKLNEIMQLRATDIPPYTPYNQKEIQNLIEMKQYWALPPDETLPDNYTEQVNVMFDTLTQLAGGEPNG